MIPDSPLPSQYGYDTYSAFNCSGEQMPVHADTENAVGFMEKVPLLADRWYNGSRENMHF